MDEALTEQPEPDTAEPLDLGDSLIAQAMREAGLNPDWRGAVGYGKP